MFVNGEEASDFEEYQIHDGDSITLVYTSNPLVTFQTNAGPILLELLPQEAPLSVANFRNYFGRYPGTIFHRAAEDVLGEFVVQGGAFAPQDVTTTDLDEIVNSLIPIDPPINEAEGGRSNQRGTVSMAENSLGATSQWFVNMRDNTTLDNQFKVFAVVLDMATVDAVAALPTSDLDGVESSNIVFDHVPYTAEGELVHVQALSGYGWVQGSIFNDLDGDGQRGVDEPGMSGVTLFGDANLNGVQDEDEVAVTSETDGDYGLFLPQGTYHIHQTIAPPFRQTHPDTPVFHVIDLTIGEYHTGVDFGNTEVVPPAAPVLLPAADSGLAGDGITNFDNSSTETALAFTVDGADTGAEIRLYADGVLIGSATADGATEVESDGSTSLNDGSRQWTATQVVDGVESLPSEALSVVIDTQVAIVTVAPDQAEVASELVYDVGSDEEGDPGLNYGLAAEPPALATIDSATGEFRWTPILADVGTHTFEITIADAAGNTASQPIELTVTVSPQMRFRLETTSLSGEVLSEVTVGETFLLYVYVQDLRDHDPAGVYAAYLDVPFDGQHVESVGEIVYGLGFPNGRAGTFDTDGLDEVGAFGPNSPLGSGELELFHVELEAVLGGDILFAGDPADTSPQSDTLFFDPPGSVDPLLIDYSTAALTVVSSVTAVDDTFNVDEDVVDVQLDVLENDASLTGAGLTITTVGEPDQGATVAISETDDLILFTPAADFFGEIRFSYEVSDGVSTAGADVVVQVANINDPPVVVDDAFSVEEDSEGNLLDVLANDLVEPDPTEEQTGWSISAVTDANFGDAQIGPNGKDIRYTPAADFFGTDTFQYTLSDGQGGQGSGVVTVTVTPRNDPPLPGDDAFSVLEDSPAQVLDVLANDETEAGETLVLTPDFAFSPSNGGTVNVVEDQLEYTPLADYFGSETFSYQVEDGNGAAATAVVTITVAGVNDDPLAVDDVFSVVKGASSTLQPLENDSIAPDADEILTIASLGVPTAGGSVQLDGTSQRVTYQPPDDAFVGSETFTYQVADGNGGLAEAVVTINVEDFVPRTIGGSVGVGDGQFPMAGLSVLLSGTNDLGELVALQTTTANDGTYQFSGVAPGAYEVTRAAAPFLLQGEQATVTVVSSAEDADNLENVFPQTGRRAEFMDLRDFLGSTPASSIFVSATDAGELDWYHLEGDWRSDPGVQVEVTADLSAVQVTVTDGGQSTVPLDAADPTQVRWLGTEDGHQLLQIPLSATELRSFASQDHGEGESVFASAGQLNSVAGYSPAIDQPPRGEGESGMARPAPPAGEDPPHRPIGTDRTPPGRLAISQVAPADRLPSVLARPDFGPASAPAPRPAATAVDACLEFWRVGEVISTSTGSLVFSPQPPPPRDLQMAAAADHDRLLTTSRELSRFPADDDLCPHSAAIFGEQIEEILPLRLASFATSIALEADPE